MKRRIFIFTTFCILNAAVSQEVTPTDVCKDDRTKNAFCNDQKNCDATGVILCYGNGLGLNIACGSNSPYCTVDENGDTCKSINPCGSSSSNKPPFQCTGLGYYPNPFDCTSYYFCSLASDKKSYTSTLYKCTSGNVFYPSAGSYCTRQNTIINNCQTVNCGNTTEPKYIQLQYGFNRQYYSLCMPDTDPMNPIVLIFACPSNSVPNLTSTPAKCSYNCWRSGFFPNSLDKSKYFECSLNNSFRLESVERRCPSGAIFESSRSECVVQLRSLSEVVKR